MIRYIIRCTHPDRPPYNGFSCTWGKGSTFNAPPETWSYDNTFATKMSAQGVMARFKKSDTDDCTWEIVPVEVSLYGLFKNNETPDTASTNWTFSAHTWGIAVKHFSKGFGGGAVYNLETGKHIANVSA